MSNKEEAERFGRTVAAQLRAEAAAQRMPVVQLAAATGINRETLDRWLKGERALSVPTLYRVADVLNIDASLIIQRAEERFESERALTDFNDGAIPYIGPGANMTEEEAFELGAVAKTGVIEVDEFES